MDFESRDQYRQAVEKLARKAKEPKRRAEWESQVAQGAIAMAAAAGGRHVGFYLVGAEERELPRCPHPFMRSISAGWGSLPQPCFGWRRTTWLRCPGGW